MPGVLVAGLAVVLLAASPVRAQFSEPASVPPPGKAATERVPILKNVSVDQRLNQQVPLSTAFVDEYGHDVTLGDYFGKRPVVLVLAYYTCPMLCNEVLSGMVGSIQTMSFNAGKDFEVVVVSFDPGDTPAIALQKKKMYFTQYGRAGTEPGFHFLTGRPEAIKAVTTAVGFHYLYDNATHQFAHPTMIAVLTPSGRISRYLMGIDYPPRDLRLALVEAANGKIGTVVDAVLLYCYHYDPATGRYGAAVMNLVRLGGALLLASVGAFVTLALRRERRKKRHAAALASPVTGTH